MTRSVEILALCADRIRTLNEKKFQLKSLDKGLKRLCPYIYPRTVLWRNTIASDITKLKEKKRAYKRIRLFICNRAQGQAELFQDFNLNENHVARNP